MLIGAYGMFWDRYLATWFPGSGPSAWQLLGKRGVNLPKLAVADFRRARGVYILFDDHGAYYVGLARGEGGLGQRLKQHELDKHRDAWTRFCWFSFDGVSSRPLKSSGMHTVVKRERPVPTRDESVIRELEALLITALGTRGQSKMRFQQAREWLQVLPTEEEELLDRIRHR